MNLTWLYVLAIYAIAVWLGRRGGADLPWRVAAFFYALVSLFLFRPMTQAVTNLPLDFILTLQPWTYVIRHHAALNSDMNDITQQMLPWAHQVRESWSHWHVPLWNGNAGSGYPLLANGQSGALSVLRLIALPLTLAHSFTAEAAMKLLTAATFTYLFCRRRGYSELASAVGGVGFGFCTFLVVWLHFPHSSVACFLPAAFYAVDLLAERVTYGRGIFAAAIWTVLVLGGHPESSAHIFFLALTMVLWIALVERPWSMTLRQAARFLAALTGALTLSFVLCSPFLIPLMEGLTKSQRFQQLQIAPNPETTFADFGSKVILFQPHFYGEPPIEQPWGPETAESITGFAGILGIAGWIALLLNAVIERRFRSREIYLLLATLMVLGIILGWPVISTLFHAALSLAANARVRLLLGFLLAIQAAAFVDLIERRRAICCLVGLLVVAGTLGALTATVPTEEWQRGSTLLAILPSMMVVAVAAIATVAGKRKPALLMLLLVCVVAEMWTAGTSWNPITPERMMYPRTPLIRALERFRDEAPLSPFRIVGIGPVFFPNTAAMYGLDDIRSHDPMSNGRYLGLMRVLTGYTVDEYFAMWKDVRSGVLDYLNVRYIITAPAVALDDTRRFQLVYDGDDGRIFENRTALPRFFAPKVVVLEHDMVPFVRALQAKTDWKNTAIVQRLDLDNDRARKELLNPRPPESGETTVNFVQADDSSYHLSVDATRFTLIASSIPTWPGWRVRINGRVQKLIEVNGVFLGFVVPPGHSDIRVRFDPLSFRIALVAALLALAVVAALFRRSWRLRVW